MKNFKVGQQVWTLDSGTRVEGEIIDLSDKQVRIQWNDLPDPVWHDPKEFSKTNIRIKS